MKMLKESMSATTIMTPVVLLTDAFVANGSAAWKLPNLNEYAKIDYFYNMNIFIIKSRNISFLPIPVRTS